MKQSVYKSLILEMEKSLKNKKRKKSDILIAENTKHLVKTRSSNLKDFLLDNGAL